MSNLESIKKDRNLDENWMGINLTCIWDKDQRNIKSIVKFRFAPYSTLSKYAKKINENILTERVQFQFSGIHWRIKI